MCRVPQIFLFLYLEYSNIGAIKQNKIKSVVDNEQYYSILDAIIIEVQ